jgi:hypothetical protein
MVSVSSHTLGPLTPVIYKQSDGKLQIYPSGMGGAVLMLTCEEWDQLSRAVTTFIEKGQP